MRADLTLTMRERGGHAVVRPEGELDVSTVTILDSALRRLNDSHDRVTVDLRGLAFIDCSGVRCLLAADFRARDAGVRLDLVEGAEQVRRVFELTGAADALTFVSLRAGASGVRRKRAAA